LDAHVRLREHRGRETYERGERDQEDVEGIDEELAVERKQRTFGDDARGERGCREEGREADRDVDLRRDTPMAERAEDRGARKWQPKDEEDLDHSGSFNFSRCLRSRLSNCSRIWKKNTPRISMPTSTSSAMPSSTTIGMP